MISFGSDNHANIHPKILPAFIESYAPFAPSYGTDQESLDLLKLLKRDFGCIDAQIVFNGTAANVLSLGLTLKSYESVLCTDVSHLNVDECGAPEKLTGCKLLPVPHVNGKLPIEDLKNYLVRRGDQHCSQIKMISITQPTELGTVYSLSELQRIRDFCDKNQLYLHIDGARLANACFYLNCSFKDILKFADVASVGGAKNGLLLGELVIINNPTLTNGFKFLRKQYLQLPSKTRYLAKQFLLYFTNNTWLEIAEHQHALAKQLAQNIHDLGVKISYPVESNAVFCVFPQIAIKQLREQFFFYVWNEHSFECRLMTSFATTPEHIESFTKAIYHALKKIKDTTICKNPIHQ